MKKWIQGILALTLVASMSISSFAAGSLFKDVESNHWALSAINTVTEKDIMPDYKDGSFKPLQKVTKVEGVVISYRLMKASNQLGTFTAADSVKRHKDALSAAGIPSLLEPYSSEVYTAFGFALDKNIITKEDLSSYMASGKAKEATKEELVAMFGKTLNLVKNQNLSGKIISLSFLDNADIAISAAPYVNLMVDYKLIGKTGDASGKFNPKSTVGRDGTASLAAGVYAAMTGTTNVVVANPPTTTPTTPSTVTPVPTTPTTPVPTTPSTATPTVPTSTTGTGSTNTGTINNTTTSANGTVSLVYTDKLSIEVKDRLDRSNVFQLSGTEILKNNERIGFLNLVVGDEVTLTLVNGKVTKMVVEKKYPTAEGKFVELSKPQTDTATKKVSRVLTYLQADGKKAYKKVESVIVVNVDNAEKKIEDLVVGDKVIISYEGYVATKIEAYSAKNELLITLAKPFELKVGNVLTYKLPDGRILDYKMVSVPEVTKSGTKELKKGDIVKATFNFGELKKMEATGMVAEDAGTIRELLISDGVSKITILNKQAERKTYNIQNKVVVSIGENKTNIEGLYQLRIGQEVGLEMDTAGVYNLSISKVLERTKLTLTLMEVVKDNLIKATDIDGRIWVVNIKEGSGILGGSFKAGDRIDVSGIKLSDQLFEAESMIKVNQ